MFFRKTVRIVIKDKNLAFEVKTGANLYTALIDENVIQPTLCKGGGQCGKCKVKITGKSIAKPTKKEQLVLARINLDAGYRLACQTVIKGDMVVDTSEIAMTDIPDDLFIRPVNTVPSTQEIKDRNAKMEPPAIEDNSQVTLEDDTEEKNEDTPVAQNQLSNNKQPVQPVATVKYDNADSINKSSVQQIMDNAEDSSTRDGILFIKNRGQLRYFLYSSVIDGIAQEDVIKNPQEFESYRKQGMLPDFIHDNLRIKDIDRIIILSDEQREEGEELLGAASYHPSDIGMMTCETVNALPQNKDILLFLRLLGVKGKKRLLISLDKLNDSYYIDDKSVSRIVTDPPGNIQNILDIAPAAENPVISISDDLLSVVPLNKYNPPDSVPLHILLKAAARMKKIGIVDSGLNIAARSELNGTVPLEYVVKVAENANENSFYVYRSKESSLPIAQSSLSALMKIGTHIKTVIDITEQSAGNIEGIVIATPAPIPGIIEHMTELGMIPKRYAGSVSYSSGDSSVIAVKLFQEPDIRHYVQKNFGGYSVK